MPKITHLRDAPGAGWYYDGPGRVHCGRDILPKPLYIVVCRQVGTSRTRVVGKLETGRGVGRGRKKKVHLPGVGDVEAEVIPFRGDVEHWNEYLLDDGSVVRMKAVVTEIVRVEGQYDPEGNPAYMVFSTNVTHVSSPEDLKKGGGRP